MAGLTLSSQGSEFPVLKPAAFAPHIARFNAMEDENVTNLVSNARALDWLAANIPRFECPDGEVEEIYYFRWWSFRKHLKQTTNGFVFTEFLVPMRHAGLHNTISCAAGHHLAEGRWLDAFLTYTRSQRFDGLPYIGEYLDETTGAWLKGRQERSRYYNHSTFADLIITGIAGLRPRPDDVVEVHPLLPDGTWDWFCLDGVNYHGRMLTILWDRDGSRYAQGAGLRIFADGNLIARSDKLERTTGRLP